MRLPRPRLAAPKSLYARSILIVILPIFLMQVIVTFVFTDENWEDTTARLARGAAADLALLTALYADADDDLERRELFDDAARELEYLMRYQPDTVLPARNQTARFDPFDRLLRRELDWYLGVPFWYDTESDPDSVEVRVAYEGGALVYTVPRKRVQVANGPIFILWLVVVTVLLGYVAVVFLRNQVRSITRLAAAAEAFGRGRDAPEFKPSGAREVRQAGHAFLAMRARIRRHLRQRTEMLAGVSHDLRTPLTRLKLHLALLPEDEDTDAMRRDVVEMERMLEDYLSFARGEDEASVESVDLFALAEEVATGARRTGRALQLGVPRDFTVQARPVGLVRAIQNLTGNALRHARTVRLSAEARGDEALIHVDDDGPGIPQDQREAALRPFTRLDPARGEGGTGLGLAIVRDFARGHGGRLTLSDGPLGGLRATISLPR